MPPSERHTFRLGYRRRKSDQMMSAATCTMFTGMSVSVTSTGDSTDVIGISDDEPMWKQTIVPSSAHAAQNGSHHSLCKLGKPVFSGFSENVNAWQPFVAMRRTSATIASWSQTGGIASGMNRPGCVPHHSSTCQLLYAWSTGSALSSPAAPPAWNMRPPKPGNDGKHIEPSTPFTFMSRTRASIS